MQKRSRTLFSRETGYDFGYSIERITMHGLRFSWRQTPVQAAIAFVLAGATLASVPAHAHGQDGAASAPAAVPATTSMTT